MRGKALAVDDCGAGVGITPAHAGKRRRATRRSSRWRDHPRPCGEKSKIQMKDWAKKGSPPPMRGKGGKQYIDKAACRITPAHAGKRAAPPAASGLWRDHPRPCGEKQKYENGKMIEKGSPPPMRGKEVVDELGAVAAGITPAHAGKSDPCYSDHGGNGDHPRPCGEKRVECPCNADSTGSPPPMRGKAFSTVRAGRAAGITPAHAGKRLSRLLSSRRS